MQTVPTNFVFNYAIRFPNGQYYLGPTIVDKKGKRVNDPNSLGPKHSAYTYTKARAHNVIAENPNVFAGCTVERVL